MGHLSTELIEVKKKAISAAYKKHHGHASGEAIVHTVVLQGQAAIICESCGHHETLANIEAVALKLEEPNEDH